MGPQPVADGPLRSLWASMVDAADRCASAGTDIPLAKQLDKLPVSDRRGNRRAAGNDAGATSTTDANVPATGGPP